MIRLSKIVIKPGEAWVCDGCENRPALRITALSPTGGRDSRNLEFCERCAKSLARMLKER